VSLTYRSGPPWDRVHVDAVRNVRLDIAPGEIVGLAGESGSGKTTLGKICLGLLRPTVGEVLLEGGRFDGHHGRLRGRLQLVGQHPDWSLNPRLPVRVSVEEPLAILGGLSRTERRRRVAEMLVRVGLDEGMAERYPHQLSGGQRQRVAIARALSTKPSFVVFDEVVSALDVSVQAQILNLICDLKDEGIAGLFISHDLAAVRYVSDRIAIMLGGRIVDLAPATDFYSVPEHPYSAQLYAATLDPDLDAQAVGATAG
jgi:ABC-type glutathione transport system ATPase component